MSRWGYRIFRIPGGEVLTWPSLAQLRLKRARRGNLALYRGRAWCPAVYYQAGPSKPTPQVCSKPVLQHRSDPEQVSQSANPNSAETNNVRIFFSCDYMSRCTAVPKYPDHHSSFIAFLHRHAMIHSAPSSGTLHESWVALSNALACAD